MLLDSVILFTKDRREFTWLESVCAPNYKVVMHLEVFITNEVNWEVR